MARTKSHHPFTRHHIARPVDPNLITREQAAVILGLSTAGVANLTELSVYRIARLTLLDRREVESLAESRAAARRKN